MAETTARTTTPRKRSSASAAKSTPAKSVAPKATDSPAVVTDGDTTKIQFELVADGETKTYAKFRVPDGNGCVGSIYAPKGTQIVKVLLIGPADE
jgi:hypothetical protein